MRLTIRLDDVTPDMDMQKFDSFCALMDRYDIQPLLGIIPDCRDKSLLQPDTDTPEGARRAEAFWKRMKALEDKGYVLAMHGDTHAYTTRAAGLFPLNRQSEFAGLSLAEQTEKIAHGKHCLEEQGIHTEIFMAPSHTFDRNTIRALLENGFTAITDGFGDCPYSAFGIIFYPISFLRKRSIKRAQAIDTEEVKKKKSLQDRAMTTLVVHPNTLTEKEMQEYETLFASGCVRSYREMLAAGTGQQSRWKPIAYYWMALAKRLVRTAGDVKRMVWRKQQ